DREQVLEHYLEKIASVYDSLYTAVETNSPVNLRSLHRAIGGYRMAFHHLFR
ncbi:hypothetical protein MJI52_23650, partial [Salmonella enterica subsp. enterica serovar Montevideo]|nr:hypothetical protein [Salmonella enterica subsp. enterica serovar Montevideo]